MFESFNDKSEGWEGDLEEMLAQWTSVSFKNDDWMRVMMALINTLLLVVRGTDLEEDERRAHLLETGNLIRELQRQIGFDDAVMTRMMKEFGEVKLMFVKGGGGIFNEPSPN